MNSVNPEISSAQGPSRSWYFLMFCQEVTLILQALALLHLSS